MRQDREGFMRALMDTYTNGPYDAVILTYELYELLLTDDSFLPSRGHSMMGRIYGMDVFVQDVAKPLLFNKSDMFPVASDYQKT